MAPLTYETGIVQLGPYRGQSYYHLVRTSLPGWVSVELYDEGMRARRDIPERYLEQEISSHDLRRATETRGQNSLGGTALERGIPAAESKDAGRN